LVMDRRVRRHIEKVELVNIENLRIVYLSSVQMEFGVGEGFTSFEAPEISDLNID